MGKWSSSLLHGPNLVFKIIACTSWAVAFANASCLWAQPSAPQSSETMTTRVDKLLDEQLRKIGWEPAGDCSDAAFIRRAYLDLTGSPPTGSEVLEFLRSQDAGKRAVLIDQLLATPTSATHLASVWAGWMLPEDSTPQFETGRSGLQNWLRDRFAENLRYDRLVSDLMVASGPAQSGPTAFFVALEGKPEKIAAKTARVFLGVQLDCAECHDHPFDDWSQQDFWGFAAYFAQLSTNPEQAMAGAGQVTDVGEGEVTLPGSEAVVVPKPLVQTGFSGISRGTRRQQLTLWLTARENPFLARATVNRVWSLLFGRGLIEPIDDMRNLEMASHPQLLAELSDYFASTGYDLRDLMSTLAKTRAYRRDTLHLSGTPPEASYAVMLTKPLTETQMSASLAQVARQIAAANAPAQNALLSQLGKLRGDASEAKLGIVAALVTLHGEAFDVVSRERSSRLLRALDAPYLDARGQFKWLFLSTLSRPPSQEEEIAFSGVLHGATNGGPEVDGQPNEQGRDKAWQSDLLWALINSTEFAMTP